MKAGRYPMDVLLSRLAADDEHHAAVMLDCTPERVLEYQVSGLTLAQAEDFADHLGWHPTEVWPEMRLDPATAPEALPWGVRDDHREERLDGTLLSARKACRIVGVSYRQLDYWVRACGLDLKVEGNGSGTRRRLSHRDVQTLDLVARMRRAGFDDVKSLISMIEAQWDSGMTEAVFVLSDEVTVRLPVRTVAEIEASSTIEGKDRYGR